MDISKAALPPRQPRIVEQDRKHPLFQKYYVYRSAMSIKLVEADSFKDWLNKRNRELAHREIAKHPRMKEFQEWMCATKGGTPGKTELRFPENFIAWLEGARW